MYGIIKDVITAGNFKLEETKHKVKKLYLWGDITEAQADELIALMARNLSADAERPETVELVNRLADKIAKIEAEIATLKAGDGASEPTEEYPVWQAWNGLPGSGYDYDQIVRHPETGVLWQSKYTGGKNTWEPGVLGTEQVWVRYIPENMEE
jgi:hypothetical protein